jgi:hypothetical protein
MPPRGGEPRCMAVLTVKYFSTLSTFGTPQDVTLDEPRIKSFFPADDAPAKVFRRLAVEDPEGTGKPAPLVRDRLMHVGG